MTKTKKSSLKLLSFLLTLAMLVGLMPGMSMTAYADNTCTVTFKANGRTVSKEVTLPHTFSCNYSSENGEFDLIIKELYQLDGGCCAMITPTVSGSTNVTGGISGDNQYITVNAPFEGTATFDSTYFDSGYSDFEIHLEISCTGAVAAYSVTITPGSNMTKTSDSGAASQTVESGAMTPVVYTANDGYYFPENYSVAAVNGISVTRTSSTQITVSGTPTADASIILTAPTASAEGESTYTITIPSTLTVENSGWNSIGNLSASGTLEDGKKLNITATSENSWKLTSGENTVAYKLCGETEKEKTYADAADTTALDISKESLEQTGGFSVPIGIVVEDYSTKLAGTYTDTVTFTASVVDNSVKVTSITLNKTSTVIGVSGEKTLSVSQILPADATDKTYTWASDNPSIATVDSNGKVTGVAIGTANITAIANDGSGIKATCVVKVALSETITVKGGFGEPEEPYTYVGTNFQVACDKTDDHATQIWQGDSKMVITATSGKTIISVELKGPNGGNIENGNTLVLSSGTIDGNTVNNVNAESLTISQVAWTQTELGSVTIYYQ